MGLLCFFCTMQFRLKIRENNLANQSNTYGNKDKERDKPIET